jgi:hypothetical protein
VRANLQTSELKYKLVRPTEFGVGIWNVSLASVTYEGNINLNFQAYITCNVVTSKTYNENFELIDYEQPLATFYVDLNQRVTKKQVQFSPMWFPINSPHEDIIFKVWNLSTNLPVSGNFEVILNVLFQNIRP